MNRHRAVGNQIGVFIYFQVFRLQIPGKNVKVLSPFSENQAFVRLNKICIACFRNEPILVRLSVMLIFYI